MLFAQGATLVRTQILTVFLWESPIWRFLDKSDLRRLDSSSLPATIATPVPVSVPFLAITVAVSVSLVPVAFVIANPIVVLIGKSGSVNIVAPFFPIVADPVLVGINKISSLHLLCALYLVVADSILVFVHEVLACGRWIRCFSGTVLSGSCRNDPKKQN
jgi:hypothetical protein